MPSAEPPLADVAIPNCFQLAYQDDFRTTDGLGCVTEANIDSFVNGEPISYHDVVVWYAGHVTHDVGAEPPGVFGHICGPDLKPVNW